MDKVFVMYVWEWEFGYLEFIWGLIVLCVVVCWGFYGEIGGGVREFLKFIG